MKFGGRIPKKGLGQEGREDLGERGAESTAEAARKRSLVVEGRIGSIEQSVVINIFQNS
jgi:hypothetical protein